MTSSAPRCVIGSMRGMTFGPQVSFRMRFLVASAILLAACARAPRVVEVPPPAPTPPPVEPARDTAPPPPDTLVSYRVPAFRGEPLIAWGALPPGEAHAERRPVFDLQHQDTRIRFDWTRHAVVGSTTIRVAALDSGLSVLSFDAVGMKIAAVRTTTGTALHHDYDGRTLSIRLASRLAPRARTTVVIDYETVRPKKGVYFVDRRHTVWTQGETEDTRYWVPTYDYPNDKTTWEFRIITDRNERALSNGRMIASRAVPNGIEWHWSQTKPASTYLMSVVTGDYVVLQDVWREIPIGYWTYPDSVEAAWRGFAQTPRMVDLFSERSGVLYPWAKYDQSVAPDYIFGGMENVSATTQADDRILHPSWAEPQANAESLVAHELAHQWYGNYVTARSWPHIWLNEGFATFFEAVWAEHTHGSDAGALARLAAQSETIAADRGARRPLVYDRWVTDPLELFFSGHIYPKGATVLQMLRHGVGDSLFWSGMRAYTRAHALGSATSDDFQRDMERATGRDLSAFFDQWVRRAGVPAFQVSYVVDSSARTLTLTARQVQPRDSLTGLFDADVDIEVLTTAGVVRGMMPIRGEISSLTVSLPALPQSIRWDKGNWLLDVVDFPRPTVMLAYQLAHDDDILGRIEAAGLLAERQGDPKAVPALRIAVLSDASPAVRSHASTALGALGADSGAIDALLRATNDADARVRQAAATAIGDAVTRAMRRDIVASDTMMRVGPGDVPQARQRLRQLVSSDPSGYVRGAALVAYAAISPEDALSVIEPVLSRESWLDMDRTAAVNALARVDTPESWSATLRFLATGTSRRTRDAAIASLVTRASGREPELATALAPLLNSDDLFIRTAAASALGRIGQRSAIPALEGRLAIEAESRVINVILGALTALRAGE
jgi:aminopeptidase N